MFRPSRAILRWWITAPASAWWSVFCFFVFAGFNHDRHTLPLTPRPESRFKVKPDRDKRFTDMDREERQIFWSNVVRDPDEDMKNRLKASELLGRSAADFTEKVFDATPPLAPAIQVVFVKADTALEG